MIWILINDMQMDDMNISDMQMDDMNINDNMKWIMDMQSRFPMN